MSRDSADIRVTRGEHGAWIVTVTSGCHGFASTGEGLMETIEDAVGKWRAFENSSRQDDLELPYRVGD